MHVEIETADGLAAHLALHGDLRKVVVQEADLRGLTPALLAVSGLGAVFLGCELDSRAAAHLVTTGALVFPSLADRPYRAYRPGLYTPDELMEGYEEGRPQSFWESSRDARIYHHVQGFRHAGEPVPVLEAMAQRLHDHAIEDAKHDLLREGEKRCVAIMGGHAMRRDDPAFLLVATIAHRLARAGYFLVSGGGPGAMEATNLGAWLASEDERVLLEAVALLAPAPTYRDAGWFDTALAVRARLGGGVESLGIPTWFYGHEPSNLFATHVAKFFSNSLREDGLLAIATHGVIYAPGSAGTVQEVFMDACQNHYGVFGVVSPMVFLGKAYWNERLPVEPLLTALARGRQYAHALAFCDTADEVCAAITAHPPVPYVK
jgi:predicted Rossmann-fold nucleotide-binding protein